jgi:DNA-binding NarL/FixJ family response regulator
MITLYIVRNEKMIPQKIRVLIADQNSLVRAGMRAVVSAEEDLLLVGEVTSGFDIQRLSQELRPNVLLIDLDTIGSALPELTAYLSKNSSEIKVVLLSTSNDIHVQDLVTNGVVGCALKDEETETLVFAIRTVVKGYVWFSQSVLKNLFQREISNSFQAQLSNLTDREQEVLIMIAKGWDNIRISTELSLALQTVRNYISRIYQKITVSSRAEAVVWARKRGFRE